jgi:NTE family protein
MLTTLCLSSGGGAGLIHVGFLAALQEEGLLDRVDTVVTCSIGSIVGMLWTLGMPLAEIRRSLETLNEDTIVNWKTIGRDVLETYALDDGEYLTAYLADLVMGLGHDPKMTLRELRGATGKRLVVAAMNFDDVRLEYFAPDDETSAEIPLLSAVRASTALPVGFAALEWNGKQYLDGGLRDPYPIAHATRITPPGHRVLGCKIECRFRGRVRSFEDYIWRLLECVHREEAVDPRNTCIVEVSGRTTLDLGKSEDEQSRLFELGWDAFQRNKSNLEL